MNLEMSLAAVSMRSALKYRRNWNKNGPAVKLLQSLMPQGSKKKGYRLYIEPGQQAKMRYTVPPAVRVAVQRAGYIITDYLAKKCVKASDKEQKNVFNIGKVIAKDPHAKAAFDNDPQLQNTKSQNIQVVISCHPYDIIGMSTGRDWDMQSCMRLKDFREGVSDGQYNRHVKADVAEGTLVAYAIREGDNNIQKPLCRCLLKPFVNDDGDVLYRRETSIYGNPAPGFAGALNVFLRKINAHVPEGFYQVVDGLYNDGAGTSHEHTKREGNDAIHYEELEEDPSLIVPYVKQQLAEGNDRFNASQMLDVFEKYAKLLHEDDVNEIATLLRGNPNLEREYADRISMGQLLPVVAKIGRDAGFLDSFNNKETLSAYKEFPPTLHGRFAQSGLPVLREYVVRLENEEEPNVARMRELVSGLMNGTYPLPDETTFVDCPKMKSWVFTMASAARYMPLFGYTDYEKQVHDLLTVLDGTEKTIEEDTIEESLRIGPFTVGLGLCLLLDNDGPQLGRDDVFSIPVEEAAPMLAKRRVFKAFERLTNGNTKFFLDHVKLYAFQQCMKGSSVASQFKDIKQQIIAYMEEESENFDSTRWDAYAINALCEFHMPLLKYINPNTTGFGRNMHQTITNVMTALYKWEGAPIDVDENLFSETLLRTAIAAGRLLDPPLTLSHKVTFEDMDNDDFYEWYKENKDSGMPALGQLFGYMTFGLNEDVRKLQMLSILPLLAEGANAVGMDEDTMAFARFGMDEVARSNRIIVRAIKALPLLGTAMTQFENYVDSFELEETQDEEEAGRELIDNEEMGVQLNPDDDDYDDQYESLLEDAKKVIEDRNYKKIELNSKLVRVAEELLTQIEWDDDTQLTNLASFFDNFPEDELEEYEDNLANDGQNIADKLRGLIEQAEEYRQTAGY